MTLSIEATFENGVFVPSTRPSLAEHQRVGQIVETQPSPQIDPLDVLRRRRERRIQSDPNLAREIALSKFLGE